MRAPWRHGDTTIKAENKGKKPRSVLAFVAISYTIRRYAEDELKRGDSSHQQTHESCTGPGLSFEDR